jgi:hypothetical protein
MTANTDTLKNKYTMKFILILLLLPAICFSQSFTDRKANFPRKTEYPAVIPPAKNVWVFLMAGQSNMAGRGFVEPQDTVPDPRILSINAQGDIILAKEPLHFYEPTMTGLDCGLSFARTLLKEIPDSVSILIIPAAIGGSSVDQWLGDSLFRQVKLLTNFREKMNLALKYGEPMGILWHQGESDSKPALIKTYEEKLSRLFEQFRVYAQKPDLPIFLGEVGLFADDSTNKKLMNETIRHFAASNSHVFLVSTTDFVHKGDKLHFDSESQRKMGERMAKEFLKHKCETVVNLKIDKN